MQILAQITKIEKEEEFFVITAKDVHKYYHTLYFNGDKWKQIKEEYGCEDILGLPCILNDNGPGRLSDVIVTDTRNKPIYTDNKEVIMRGHK